MIREHVRPAMSGALVLALGLAGIAASIRLFVTSVQPPAGPPGIVGGIVAFASSLVVLCGV